jgi:general secretion pathway protein E
MWPFGPKPPQKPVSSANSSAKRPDRIGAVKPTVPRAQTPLPKRDDGSMTSGQNTTESRTKEVNGRKQPTQFMTAISGWIRYATENRATDIHIDAKDGKGCVRFRIDGELEEMRADGHGEYPTEFLNNCISSIYNASTGGNSILPFDQGKMLYRMIPFDEIQGHPLRLRFQSLSGLDCPKLSLRLVAADVRASTKSFKDLGYESSQTNLWNQAMQTPSGAVLISGITGSGKSTTIKSFIELNPQLPRMAITTIEDPIEYPIKGAHQIDFQREMEDEEATAKRFKDLLTSIMRADPDGVMIGEARDQVSANALIQIAESGHLGMATTHAHLLTGIIPRLSNERMGLSRQALCAPNILTLLVYQALVPVLCPHCSLTSEQATGIAGVGRYLAYCKSLGIDTQRLRWRKTTGCPHCSHRGTIGQTVVAEMLIPSSEWLAATRKGLDSEAMDIYRSTSNGQFDSSEMTGKTVFEHTLYKALLGQVDVRQCSRFEIFERYVSNHRKRLESTHSPIKATA